MDDSGHARIADFGLATVTQNLDSIQSATFQQGHTPRWTAPEVWNEGAYSKEADIFSFAMVMIEVRHGRSAVCLLSFHTDTGVHWRDSVQRWFIYCGYVGHNARQASTTADTSSLHGEIVGIDATVLGP